MKTLRWGLLAAGGIARAFASGLQQTDTGEALAVASRDADKAAKLAAEFDIPRHYGSYDELLADPDVDAVYIAPVHPVHAEWAIKAADAGKHILCEKPMAINRPDVDTIIAAARRNDVFLMEAFMYRCNPQTAELVRLIRDGAIGEVRLIDAVFSFHAGCNLESRILNPALGGGGIMDVGCYTVSMARLIAGAALGRDIAEPVSVSGEGHLGAESKVDEWAAALLRFEGDIVAKLATGVQLGQDNRVAIYGSEGNIHVPDPWFCNGREPGKCTIQLNSKGEAREIVLDVPKGIYAIEADTVAAHIDARQAPAPAMSWADSLGNAAVLDRWRGAIGLEYPCETVEAYSRTLDNRPLAVRSPTAMGYGTVDGIAKQISRIVMGTMIPRNIAHATAMYDDFYAHGGNCFDTAYLYGGGKSETLLGQYIRNRNLREEVTVIVKGGHTPHCYPEAILSQFHESLERMQTDYTDIYFLHRDNPDIPVGEFVDLLSGLKDQGKIRVFGGSNWTIARLEEAGEYAASNGKTPFTVLSNHFSLARMVKGMWDDTCVGSSDPESREWHRSKNVPCFAWSSQARGFFVPGLATPDRKDDALLVRTYYGEDNFERQKRCFELAREKGVHPVTIALAYVLAQDMPLWAMIGPANLTEAADSYRALTMPLTPEQVAWLNLEE